MRRGAVSRIVLCTHARTARNRVDAREPDLNSRYFIPHHSEAGKQTQYKPDVKEQTGAGTVATPPTCGAHGLQRQQSPGRQDTGLNNLEASLSRVSFPCPGVPSLSRGAFPPSPPRPPGATEHRPHLPHVLGKPALSWLSREGARRPSLHPTACTGGQGRRGLCGRTLPRHAGGSSENRLSDCDRPSPMSGLQNGHKPHASLFDKPTRPDVLGRSLSNWCKVWRSESRIFHPAYCVLSFDTGSGFTFASDYRSALIRREPALLRNE